MKKEQRDILFDKVVEAELLLGRLKYNSIYHNNIYTKKNLSTVSKLKNYVQQIEVLLNSEQSVQVSDTTEAK